MGRSKEQDSAPDGADHFEAAKSRNGKMNGKVRVMEGQPVVGEVDIVTLAAYVKQIGKAKESGKIPHRGREGEDTGQAAASGRRPHRNRNRRGTWKS